MKGNIVELLIIENNTVLPQPAGVNDLIFPRLNSNAPISIKIV